MKRAIIAALVAAALSPYSGSAQNLLDFDRPMWGPRVRVTPFGGFAASVTRNERWTVSGNGQIATADFDVSLGGGPAAGMTLETRVFERFALAASGTFVSRGRTVERLAGDAPALEHEGSTFLFGKATAVIRLREQTSELQVHTLTGSIFVGPAFIRETPKTDPKVPSALLQPLNHYGLNFGFDAEIPLSYDNVSFTAGIDDYVIWWNTTEFGRRNDQVILEQNGIESDSYVEAPPSHNVIFRAGLSLRFR